MSETGAPQEKCLFCHHSLAFADRVCPTCGKTRKAQAKEPQEVPIFEYLPPYLRSPHK